METVELHLFDDEELLNATTEEVVELYDEGLDALEYFQRFIGHIEQFLTARMELTDARRVNYPGGHVELAYPSPQYNIAKLNPLREILTPEEVKEAYTPPKPKEGMDPEKWNMTKVNKYARDYGKPVQDVLAAAKKPDITGPQVKRVKAKAEGP